MIYKEYLIIRKAISAFNINNTGGKKDGISYYNEPTNSVVKYKNKIPHGARYYLFRKEFMFYRKTYGERLKYESNMWESI